MEYTIEEMQAMLNIVSAVLGNRRFQQGSALRTSTVYDIDDFDIATMENGLHIGSERLTQQNRLRNEDDNRQTDCLHKQMQVCN